MYLRISEGLSKQEMQQRKEESLRKEGLLLDTRKTIAPEETTTMITLRVLPEIHRTIRKADMEAEVRTEFIQRATSSSPTTPLQEADRVAGIILIQTLVPSVIIRADGFPR